MFINISLCCDFHLGYNFLVGVRISCIRVDKDCQYAIQFTCGSYVIMHATSFKTAKEFDNIIYQEFINNGRNAVWNNNYLEELSENWNIPYRTRLQDRGKSLLFSFHPCRIEICYVPPYLHLAQLK